MTTIDIAGALLIGLNLIASARVLMDGLSTGAQKLLQLLFVWLIPIAGALFTLSILRHTTPHRGAVIRAALLPSWFTVGVFGAADSGSDHSVSGLDGGSSHGGDGGGSGGGDA